MKYLILVLTILLQASACSSDGKSGDDDTDTGADSDSDTDTDTDTDTDSDTDSDTDTDTDTDADTDTDTDTDTDSGTGSEQCQIMHDIALGLCGTVRPDMLECCNTLWDQMLDMELMYSCMLEADACLDLMDCDAEATYCLPDYCPTGDVCCEEFGGEWGEIVDAFECSNFSWYEGGDGCWNVQVCYLGECVPAEDVVDGLCP